MKISESHVLQALRGANTCESNSSKSIGNAVKELIDELQKRNDLKPEQIVSITFSVTKDLDACFPASIARQHLGLDKVALLDCQQMHVKNDLKNCIRILAFAWLAPNQNPKHPYLGKATTLRPDR
tara:strand:+ start:830 stop:1204 length:375 start_codon:yes stop_codon:yes gene_type:complete